MPNQIRSARGELINFELLAIKQQLASAPAPKIVEDRKQAIDEKDGVRSDVKMDVDYLAASIAAANQSAAASKTAKKK